MRYTEYLSENIVSPSQTGAPRWEKVKVWPFYKSIDLCNGTTMYQIGAFFTQDGRFFIGIEYKSAFCFARGFKHWQYIAEKLNLYEADARNLTDWINTQIADLSEYKEQGVYI